jgi:CheY-like chemotaxis protein
MSSERKTTILIVEDSLIVAMHLQSTLESEGYSVIGKCSSGEEAIQFAEQGEIDLVLMDIMLSGKLDGIETSEILRRRFRIPVIYITALTDKSTIHRAKLTEPYGYLTKPFEDREIFTVIEMALYKHAIEVKLKESEDKYFSTVKSISDAVVVIDKDFLITYINQVHRLCCSVMRRMLKGNRLWKWLRLWTLEPESFHSVRWCVP